MVQQTIIKTITSDNYTSKIIPVYLAQQHSKILSLKAQSRLVSYSLHPYPSSLSPENTQELNEGLITTYDCNHAQILINLFLMDLERWNFIRSEFIVNHGGIIETSIIDSYISDFRHFVLQRGFALGIHVQCLGHFLMAGDVITIIGHAETAEEATFPTYELIPVPENIYFAAPSLPLPTPQGGLILDSYPGAIAGFSLRRLMENYGGPIIRVRRADGVEADIGLEGDRLDFVHLLDFASSSGEHGDVEVLTWYDQTGQYGDLYAPKSSQYEKRPLILQYNGEYQIYEGGLGYQLRKGELIRDDRYRELSYMYFQRYSYLRGEDNVGIIGGASRRLAVVAGRFAYGNASYNHYLCGFGGAYAPEFYGVAYFYRQSRPSYTRQVYLSVGKIGSGEQRVSSLRYYGTNIICATYYSGTKVNHISVNGDYDVGGRAMITSEFVLETSDGPLAIGTTSIPPSLEESIGVQLMERRTGNFACYEVLLWGHRDSTDLWTPGRETHWDIAIDLDVYYPTFQVGNNRYNRPGSIVYNV